MYRQVSYNEMLVEAQKIHPRLFPHLNENGAWIFVLDNTEQESVYDALSEDFKGTPAWEAFHTPSDGSDVLTLWGDSFGFRDYPLDVIAPRFNQHYRWETDYSNQIRVKFPKGYSEKESQLAEFRAEHERIIALLTEKYETERAEAEKVIQKYENTKVIL